MNSFKYRKYYKVILSLFILMNLYISDVKSVAVIHKQTEYPEWGFTLNIYTILLYISIVLVIFGIIKDIFKKSNKQINRIDKYVGISVFFSFCVTVISRALVQLNIYNNTVIYLIIGITVSAIMVYFLKDKEILLSKKIYLLMLLILIIFLGTKDSIILVEYFGGEELMIKNNIN